MPIPKISRRLSPSLPPLETNEMQMAGSEWRSGMFSDLDAGPYPPPPPLSSAYPSRSRTPRGKPWKTRSKRCARRQNRPGGAFTAFTVHVIHLLFSFFFLLPPRIGENPIQGAPSLYFHPTLYISARVCVCVIDARVSIYPRARSTSRDISLRPKKGSRSHRERERERKRERDRRVKDLLLRCHLVPGAQWAGPSAIRLFGYIFFPTKEERRRGG